MFKMEVHGRLLPEVGGKMAGPASLPVTCPGLHNTTHPSVCATLLLQGTEMKESVFPATSVVDAATTATSVQRLVWHVFVWKDGPLCGGLSESPPTVGGLRQ